MVIESFRGDYFFLSSMYPVREGVVAPDDKVVPTVEHAYQAAKFIEPEARQQVLQAVDGFKAKKISRVLAKHGHPIRPDWEEARIDVMRQFVESKFTRSGQLARMLLETDGEELVEGNGWDDTFWGKCLSHDSGDGNRLEGQNHLGKILMETREKLRTGELVPLTAKERKQQT